MSTPLIALLTDFGTRDWYVATLKAVILSRCPRAQLIDITHEVPPQDTVAGAFTLAAAVRWFPSGTVFLGIVDPGVGSQRAILAARADRYYFVGPDNGLLTLCFQHAKRLAIVRVTNRRYWLTPISRTFQGRDIMAPVAAYLANGGSLSRLGKPLQRTTSLPLPPIEQRERVTRGSIVHIDAFGNLITNLAGTLLASNRPVLRYKQRRVRVVSSYAVGRPNELVALVGSLGLLELAIRNMSAAWTLSATRGDEVTLST